MRNPAIATVISLLVCLIIGSYQANALLSVETTKQPLTTIQNQKTSPCEQQSRGVNQCTTKVQYSAADLFELPQISLPLLNMMLLLFSYCFIIKVTTNSPLKRPPKTLRTLFA